MMRPGVVRGIYGVLGVLSICIGLMGSPSDLAWMVIWLVTGLAVLASGFWFAAWLEREERHGRSRW